MIRNNADDSIEGLLTGQAARLGSNALIDLSQAALRRAAREILGGVVSYSY